MDSRPEVKPDPRRGLPAVDRVIEATLSGWPDLPRWAAAEGAREVLAAERRRLSDPEGPTAGADLDELARRAARLAAGISATWPTRVVNATGIVLHTNLGRAPLAPGAAQAVAAAASAYGDLELDLETGRRGDRLAGVARKLALLANAEAAHAVNNNAAALFLALNTLALGKEVIVSRGELVEIGGSFRVPAIMERAGVRLVEVGSTNRTHRADYERAIGPDTAALLKVHASNFEQRGFVSEVGLAELAEVGRARGVPVIEDLGSGTLVDLSAHGFPAEADARSRLGLGADVVCFSGDKLLGGPQAGILLGGRDVIAQMRRNPVARAFRLDKLSLAALDWTLGAYLDGRAETEIPVLRQLLEPVSQLEIRAKALAERLAKAAGDAARVEAAPARGLVGGGSLPGFELDTWVVTVAAEAGADAIAGRLRGARDPVLARVRDDQVWIDVRTLLEDDSERLEAAVREAFEPAPR